MVTRRYFTTSIIALLSGLAAGCASFPHARKPLASIEGNVFTREIRDANKGMLVENAKVTLYTLDHNNQVKLRTTRTDHRGHFRFTNVPGGTYIVQVDNGDDRIVHVSKDQGYYVGAFRRYRS